MFSFEYLEVFIEERSISLEFLLTCDVALAVVSRIDQMIENVLLAYLWLLVPNLTDDLLDLLVS